MSQTDRQTTDRLNTVPTARPLVRSAKNYLSSNLVCSFISEMPSGRTNNFPESGRGLGHVTPIIFGSPRSAILATAWLLVLFADRTELADHA